MFLDLNSVADYDKEIAPFLKNGVIIDTSVFLNVIDGLVCTKISNKRSLEFEKILKFLDALNLTGKWDKFFITPHILTEVCTHLRNDYNSRKDVISEIMPLMKSMGEKPVSKDDFIKHIDLENPIVEAGDISIFVTTNDFTEKKEKVAFLSNDRRLNGKYKDHPHIMVMDYQSAILNAL